MGKAVAIIPARLGSTRFPRKVLAAVTGRALVLHVCDAAARATSVGRVVVATDSEDVARVVRDGGVEAVMTGEHPNGTSRLNEAAERLGLGDEDVVVNVQGDEPEIDPEVIDAAVEALRRSNAPVATVASPVPRDAGELRDVNVVKVVLRRDGTAMYFSRAPIPCDRDGDGDVLPLRHVGLYVYQRGFLRTYAGLAPTALEQVEKLEQLRVLEHGYVIAVAVRETHHVGIDTREQYERFVGRWGKRR